MDTASEMSVIHRCPADGEGIMSCCGRTPFEVRYEQITVDPLLVTCRGYPFSVVITGSRDWGDIGAIERTLGDLLDSHPGLRVHVGDASGADAIAWAVCQELEIPCRVYGAEWGEYGRAAGPIRNRQMLDAAQPDLVVAFPLEGSKGTWDCVGAARDRGLAVVVEEVDA